MKSNFWFCLLGHILEPKFQRFQQKSAHFQKISVSILCRSCKVAIWRNVTLPIPQYCRSRHLRTPHGHVGQAKFLLNLLSKFTLFNTSLDAPTIQLADSMRHVGLIKLKVAFFDWSVKATSKKSPLKFHIKWPGRQTNDASSVIFTYIIAGLLLVNMPLCMQ